MTHPFEQEYKPKEPEDDAAAWTILRTNYKDDRGIIRPHWDGYKPNVDEWAAIVYLCQEWDYAFSDGSTTLAGYSE